MIFSNFISGTKLEEQAAEDPAMEASLGFLEGATEHTAAGAGVTGKLRRLVQVSTSMFVGKQRTTAAAALVAPSATVNSDNNDNKSESEAKAPADWQLERKYTLNEVQQHSSLDDCWMVIFDKVYNITEFVFEHPGGDFILLEYAGRDATHPFLSSRHGSSAYKMLDKYWIGILVDEELYYSNNSSYCSVYSNLSWRSTPTLEETTTTTSDNSSSTLRKPKATSSTTTTTTTANVQPQATEVDDQRPEAEAACERVESEPESQQQQQQQQQQITAHQTTAASTTTTTHAHEGPLTATNTNQRTTSTSGSNSSSSSRSSSRNNITPAEHNDAHDIHYHEHQYRYEHDDSSDDDDDEVAVDEQGGEHEPVEEDDDDDDNQDDVDDDDVCNVGDETSDDSDCHTCSAHTLLQFNRQHH